MAPDGAHPLDVVFVRGARSGRWWWVRDLIDRQSTEALTGAPYEHEKAGAYPMAAGFALADMPLASDLPAPI